MDRWKQKSANYMVDYKFLNFENQVAKGLLHEMMHNNIDMYIAEELLYIVSETLAMCL